MKTFHSYLKKYDNIHSDKVGVIFGTGPSLLDFSFDLIPENRDDLILYGCNTMCYYEDIELDYYFCGDLTAGDLKPFVDKNTKKKLFHTMNTTNKVAKKHFGIDYQDKIKWYVKNILKKDAFMLSHVGEYIRPSDKRISAEQKHGFVERIIPIRADGDVRKPFDGLTRDGYINEENLRFRHHVADEVGCNCVSSTKTIFYEYKADMSQHFFWCKGMIFPPLQFAMYSGVKKIYLVGCDAGGKAKFFLNDIKQSEEEILYDPQNWSKVMTKGNLHQWAKFRRYRDRCFPNIKVININPGNLEKYWDGNIYSNKDENI